MNVTWFYAEGRLGHAADGSGSRETRACRSSSWKILAIGAVAERDDVFEGGGPRARPRSRTSLPAGQLKEFATLTRHYEKLGRPPSSPAWATATRKDAARVRGDRPPERASSPHSTTKNEFLGIVAHDLEIR